MKRYLLLLLALLLCGVVDAQSDLRKQYEQFRQRRQQEYQDFRAKANADFAEFLKNRWKDYQPKAALPVPIPDVLPTPQTAPAEDASPIAPRPTTLPESARDTKEVQVIADRERPATSALPEGAVLRVDFFGDALSVPCTKQQLPRLQSVDETGFSTMWSAFGKATAGTVKSLEGYISGHALNGWGCYQLVKRVSEVAYGEKQPNERIAMQAYLLSQLNYCAQVASCSNKLVLLLPFKESVYSVPFLEMGGRRYYIYSYGHQGNAGYRTYENKFEYAQKQLSLQMHGSMQVGEVKQVKFERMSAVLGTSLSAPIRVGNVALTYYYPIVDNTVYYRQTLAADFARAILTPIKQKVQGKSELEAVNFLLNLVQNGFQYATDEEVFGRQKQLFIEESFFYGKNNCKDRVGVFSWLVKEILGLQVIAVQFDGNQASGGVAHIACAVAFTEQVSGDAYQYGNRRYVMCDPTYINAGVGKTMPCYVGAKGKILPL